MDHSRVLSNPLSSATPDQVIDGEPVLFRAQLSDRWLNYRACSQCCIWTWLGISTHLNPFIGLGCLLCGGSARRAEMQSFSLAITPTTLHFTMKQYACGCCCQNTVKKSIPLDKVQDVMLVSDCIGDCCGFSPAGTPWQLHVQTAGLSGGPPGVAELTVHCLHDIEGLRSNILATKRRLLQTAEDPGVVGASKDGIPRVAAAGLADNTAVLRVLERIERAVTEGVAVMAARGGAAAASAPAAGAYPAMM